MTPRRSTHHQICLAETTDQPLTSPICYNSVRRITKPETVIITWTIRQSYYVTVYKNLFSYSIFNPVKYSRPTHFQNYTRARQPVNSLTKHPFDHYIEYLIPYAPLKQLQDVF